MADDEAPSWLQENPLPSKKPLASPKLPKSAPPSVPTTTTQPAAQTVIIKETSAAEPPPYKWLVTWSFTIINLGLCVLLAATGALGVGQSTSVNSTGIVFVGIYLIVFAAILFSFEVVQICPCQMLDLPLKKNFGFLYGTNGKGLYMLFMGILAFGLSKPRELAIASGILVPTFGLLQILLYFYRPAYFDQKEKYIP